MAVARPWKWYLGALLLFVAALLSKTVTSTLPAALLLILWWKWGKFSIADLIRLTPMFVLGISLGLLTVWLDKYQVGAQGIDSTNLPPIQNSTYTYLADGRARESVCPQPRRRTNDSHPLNPSHLW